MISTEFLSKFSAVLTTYEVLCFPNEMLEDVEAKFNFYSTENKFDPDKMSGIQFLDELVDEYSHENPEQGEELEVARKILSDIIGYN